MKDAILTLEDGTTFSGKSIGIASHTVGEVVFNTSMTGYQEIITDPSYHNQIVTLTYPHIGNTGTNDEDNESRNSFISGLVIRESSPIPSNWRNKLSLEEFMVSNQIVGISNIDTRKLTNHLRNHGSMNACLSADGLSTNDALSEAKSFPGLAGLDLAKVVSTKSPYEFSPILDSSDNQFHIVAIDFGIKANILNLLSQNGCKITVIPAQSTFDQVMSYDPDGVFLSNGPGDPEPCGYAIKCIRELLQSNIPIFGICLGHQLLAIASGAKTKKMKFGHHGANHPVIDTESGVVHITSQNHGFMVNEKTVPENVRITHKSLFDQSIQGIEITDKNAFSFQGHPEASPGPHDIQPLFEKFITNIRNAKKN
ncbi:MAG: glutamine-hydrolyzing carbamoyl-phosphate synthase small subunit [Gammaproteobacteria bacterium]|nr:glutamine-hydrolyzing carbamoyl-phosphate synthase small subunit [Gammaproteobacteria bacterium]